MNRGDSFCQRVTEKEQKWSSCLIRQLHLLLFHTSLTVPPIRRAGWSPLSSRESATPHLDTWHLSLPPCISSGPAECHTAGVWGSEDGWNRKTPVNIFKKTECTSAPCNFSYWGDSLQRYINQVQPIIFIFIRNMAFKKMSYNQFSFFSQQFIKCWFIFPWILVFSANFQIYHNIAKSVNLPLFHC